MKSRILASALILSTALFPRLAAAQEGGDSDELHPLTYVALAFGAVCALVFVVTLITDTVRWSDDGYAAGTDPFPPDDVVAYISDPERFLLDVRLVRFDNAGRGRNALAALYMDSGFSPFPLLIPLAASGPPPALSR